VTDQSDRQEREIYFQGRVQGVGFRYTTERIAARFAVTGYVRNLPDRRVLLVAVGEAAELERFVQAVEEELGRHITGRQATTRPDSGQYRRFEIRY
jgi:acylphosphatase